MAVSMAVKLLGLSAALTFGAAGGSARAIDGVQRYALRQAVVDGQVTSLSPERYEILVALAKAGDGAALDYLLDLHPRLASSFISAYCAVAKQDAIIDGRIEDVFVARYADPRLATTMLELLTCNGNKLRYASPATFRLLQDDLADRPDRPRPSLVVGAILRTDLPGARAEVVRNFVEQSGASGGNPFVASFPPDDEIAVAMIASRPSKPTAADWDRMARQSRLRDSRSRWLDVRIALVHALVRSDANALPMLRLWQTGLPAGDPLAREVNDAFVRWRENGGLTMLRDRFVEIGGTEAGPAARQEMQLAAQRLLEGDRTQPLGFDQLRAFIPVSLLESDEAPWPQLRERLRFQDAAHELIGRIVAHYQALSTYRDSGTWVLERPFPGGGTALEVAFQSLFDRNGRYMYRSSDGSGGDRYLWGDPGCHHRFERGSVYPGCGEAPDRLLASAESPAMSIRAIGARRFHDTGYQYRVEALPDGPRELVALKGVRPGVPAEFEVLAVDPSTGAIRSVDRNWPDARLRVRFTASENAAIPDGEFHASFLTWARFNPWQMPLLPGLAAAFAMSAALGAAVGMLVMRSRMRGFTGRLVALRRRLEGWLLGAAAVALLLALGALVAFAGWGMVLALPLARGTVFLVTAACGGYGGLRGTLALRLRWQGPSPAHP